MTQLEKWIQELKKKSHDGLVANKDIMEFISTHNLGEEDLSALYEALHILVHMLAYKDNLLHAVTIHLVPIVTQFRFSSHKPLEFSLWHGGVPLSAVAQIELLASLFKDVAYIFLAFEVADAFSAHNVAWP